MGESTPQIGLSRKAQRTKDQPITYLMAHALANPEVISLAAGFVDAESLPAEAASKAAAEILAEPALARAALQYGTTIGVPALREKLLARFEAQEALSRRELNLAVEDVVITTGSQQMLYLLADTLIDPGDIVVNSAPSYFVYSGLLDGYGADVRSVADDEGGMSADGLEMLLERLRASGELPRVKMIYVVTYYQNPTGVSVAADRRARIVELAKRYSIHNRIVVLEDAAYRELRYDGPDLPSLKSFDPDNTTVAYTTTFSKPFSPGLKTGWSFLPKGLLAPVLRTKGNMDFGTPNFNQYLLDRVLADGAYDRQVEKLRRVYKAKRDVMLACLEEHFGPGFAGGRCSWIRPDGGLYVWFRLPEGFDTSDSGPLFQASLEHGVLYVPGDLAFTPQPGLTPPKNCMRLSFGVVGERDLRRGMARLAEAVRSVKANATRD